jgi:putative heme-binding domain-containing protein
VKLRRFGWTLAIGALLFGANLHASAVADKKQAPTTTFNAERAGAAARRPGPVLRSPRALRQSVQSPQADDPQIRAIQSGRTLFRERCADCHGAEAKGDRGPDLTRLWTSAAADDRAFQIIRSGVPGSIMPPSQAPDAEIRSVIAYLRSISTMTLASSSRGNVDNGERVFRASCGGCHRVHDRGGRLGPDLSRIASSQSRESLMRSIRDASAVITSGYESVTLVTRDGQRIRGVRKGEDAFSIQIMDTRERLQGYVKANLREALRDRESLMPSFGADRLSDADLEDVLGFLGTLRSNSAPARGGQ